MLFVDFTSDLAHLITLAITKLINVSKKNKSNAVIFKAINAVI